MSRSRFRTAPPRVSTPDALKEEHGSTLEEARADLFALYYLADPKLLELGILDNPEAYKAEYYKYLLNGLMTQLNRIEARQDVEGGTPLQPPAHSTLDSGKRQKERERRQKMSWSSRKGRQDICKGQ